MKKKILITVLTILFAIISCSGCALWDNEVNELNGSITGNTYNAGFYTNQGKNFMNVSGQKIDLQSNVIKEKTYNSNNGWGYNQTLSSVVTVIIDGKTIESCGSTMIFAENGLNPEVDFNSPEVIKSTSDGSFGDNVFIAPNCVFSTAGHAIDSEQRSRGLEIALPITVGDNVWIGTNVSVLLGVTIGSNTIIGAGSVVNKDIPEGVIAVGNPCRVLRKITDKDLVKLYSNM